MLFFPPPTEIPPPAPLQTQDGSAVAKMDITVVFLFFFLLFFLAQWPRTVPKPFYLCKDDQPTPSKHPTVKVNTSQQIGI